MKRITVVFMVLLAVCTLFSCKTAAPTIEGEVTQEKVDTVLEQIYDTVRPQLDLSGAQDYTVVKDDSLVKITQKFYGSLTAVGDAGVQNGFYFPVIMAASDTHIVDPDLIEPGLKLKIPDLKKNLDNAASRSAIKNCLIDVAYVYNKKGVAPTEAGLIKLSDSL